MNNTNCFDFLLGFLPCFKSVTAKPADDALSAKEGKGKKSIDSTPDSTLEPVSPPSRRRSTLITLPNAALLDRQLYDAVFDGDFHSAVDFLDRGADPNVKFGPRKNTAFLAACKIKNKSLMDLLISRGADQDVRDVQGNGITEMFPNYST
jgi:hypothetical protein